jgi:hypothetical protein
MVPGARALVRWFAVLVAVLALGTGIALASPAPGGDRVDAVRLAVDSSGRAVAAWAQADDARAPFRVRTAELRPGGWGAPRDLTPADESASSVDLAGNPAGDVVVAWQRDPAKGTPVRVAPRTAAGEWGPPADLPPAGLLSSGPRAAVGADGTMLVAWEIGFASQLAAAVRRPGEAWGPTRIVSGPVAPDLRWAAPVVAADGSALLAWISGPPGQRAVIAAIMPAGGPGIFADPFPLSAPGDLREAPGAALAADGSALVAWRRTMPDGITRATLVAERAPTGPWTPAAGIDTPTPFTSGGQIGAGVPAAPAAGIDAAGQSLVAWADPVGGWTVRAAAKPPAGSWAVRTLAGPGELGAPALAAGPSGSTLAMWSDGKARRTAAAAPGGPFGEVADVSPSDPDATSAAIGVDGSGALVALWRAERTGDRVVRAARRPAGGVWGATAEVSHPLTEGPRTETGQPPPRVEPKPTGEERTPPRRAGRPDRVALSVRQLRINQRIAQAALRRVRALEARVAGRRVPRRPRGAADRVRLTRGQLIVNQRISQAALRRVAALEARLEGRRPPARAPQAAPSRIRLTAGQLLIDQRIAQAALRRVAALEEGLTAR